MNARADMQVIAEAHKVSKRFGALAVLDGVDFTVRAGEAVGVVGPNGAGKTTLMNVLSGAYSPSEGQVSFAGQPVTGLTSAQRCRLGLARTHQVPQPFLGMTVFENVLVAAFHGAKAGANEAYENSHAALQTCGMLHLANRRADTIGLLDRKRLELARALATGPKLILLDEIGGGLTDSEANELVGTIRGLLAGGISVVWIEHIVHILLQVATRLVCMDQGRVIADGEPDAVMSHPAVVEAYLGRTPE